jgi:DNA-binding MarR family transcriptional regulator
LENIQKYSINRWISILYRYGQSHISKQLEFYNIGSGQYIFLIALYKKDGISQEEISDHLKIDKATTAKSIERLEKEGYVKRDIDSKDKRAYKVFLTQKAFDVRPIICSVLKKWSAVLSEGLTEDEKSIALNLLGRMAKNAFLYVDKKDLKDEDANQNN